MSKRFYWLQFFADGASGGDGGEGAAAGSGESTADAGRSLEELGVPNELAERHRKRMEKRKGKPLQNAQPGQETAQKPAQAAQEKKEEATTADSSANNGAANGDEWDAFFSKQANKDRLQQMMAERGRSATEAKAAATAQLDKLGPALKLLAEKYGVKPGEDGSFDLDAINKAVTEDDSYFENKALEMGVSVDVARKLEQADELERQQQEARQKAQRDAMLREHFDRVRQQGQALKEKYPDFDLDKELQNPEFVRRTAPGQLSVEDAYYSLHYDEIMQRQAEVIARRANRAAAQNIAAGGMRPKENGSASTAAVSATPNVRVMSKEERRAYIMRKYPPRT